METLKGGCLCGAVRLEVVSPPYRVGLCHCLDCRKNHGAIFRTFAILPPDGLRVTGETRSHDHQGKGRRHFCPTCGSPLFIEDDDGYGAVRRRPGRGRPPPADL